MKVYLAGKITGDSNYREKFAAAAKKLEERAGVTVISPAVTPEGLKKADYMRICFAMLESADTAVFLPDWEDSPGAQLEKHWCEYVGKKMVFLMEGAECSTSRATILCHPIRLRTSKRGEVAGMRNMGCSWACPAGKSWVCGTEQRRREKPLIRSSHDRSRSGNGRTGRTSCIACG